MAGSNRRLTRWLVLAALVLCFILLQRQLWFSTGSLPHGWHLAAQVRQQQKANAALHKNNARHQEEIQNLKSGTAAVEEHAREDLGLVKKGETFYQIVRAPRTASTGARPPFTAPKPSTVHGGGR
ncbi:MAG: septum formation initiator family protein [Gammaproteobacteria bacterium]